MSMCTCESSICVRMHTPVHARACICEDCIMYMCYCLLHLLVLWAFSIVSHVIDGIPQYLQVGPF